MAFGFFIEGQIRAQQSCLLRTKLKLQIIQNGFKTSVVDPDPDPYWIRIQLGLWIRIRIRIRNPDPDPGGHK